ncbi:hypothetical protein ACFVZH_20805 [Streptomyces sp. NPDC059534]|uniref:hypothetical protein n=1 Tax=Streptomyces sp. NPDC059534 TaxID=3346859 RepID=UPI0036C6B8C4
MGTPTIDGFELTIGDHLGLGITPHCCAEDMDTKQKHGDLQTLRCSNCRTALIVDGRGLVWDIQ